MNQQDFEQKLSATCEKLTAEARQNSFRSSQEFEERVRRVIQETIGAEAVIDFNPHPQAFPDIAIGKFGVEVKFTTNDTWRSVANSVLETNRVQEVKKIYLVFGKMGGEPEVKWGEYEKCIMHVRTSHVPRFEVELYPEQSLFEKMGISYDDFRESAMAKRMEYIRKYARSRLKKGERLWWLEESPDDPGHTLPIQARLYTTLTKAEKTRLRAEAALLCPQIVQSSRVRDKYNDAVLYLLTYHGVLSYQGRDLFSAGSVANPHNDDEGGSYIERALKLLEPEMLQVADRLEDALFIEYWGRTVPQGERIAEWLRKADELASDWVPSQGLFLDYQQSRRGMRRTKQ